MRSKGSPKTYRFRRVSDCFPVLAIRGISEEGTAVTALVIDCQERIDTAHGYILQGIAVDVVSRHAERLPVNILLSEQRI